MKEELIEYIKKEFVEDPDEEIDENTPLMSSGLIDSLSIVSLVAFVDKKFGVKIREGNGGELRDGESNHRDHKSA